MVRQSVDGSRRTGNTPGSGSRRRSVSAAAHRALKHMLRSARRCHPDSARRRGRGIHADQPSPRRSICPSRTSRTTASRTDSPISTEPPGKPHCPPSERWKETAASVEDDGGDSGANSDGAGHARRDHPFTYRRSCPVYVLRRDRALRPRRRGRDRRRRAEQALELSQPIGASAPTVAFSSTWAGVFRRAPR